MLQTQAGNQLHGRGNRGIQPRRLPARHIDFQRISPVYRQSAHRLPNIDFRQHRAARMDHVHSGKILQEPHQKRRRHRSAMAYDRLRNHTRSETRAHNASLRRRPAPRIHQHHTQLLLQLHLPDMRCGICDALPQDSGQRQNHLKSRPVPLHEPQTAGQSAFSVQCAQFAGLPDSGKRHRRSFAIYAQTC